MPRGPDERVEKAREMYTDGMKCVDIARALGVPDGTVRRWKSTYSWESERSDHNERSKQKANVRKESKRERADREEVKHVVEAPDLTDKQRLFCLHYVRCFNATKAYQKAYGVSYATAASIAYRLMERDGIKAEINRLKQNRLNREMLDESDIFQKYMDIAFADMNDFAEIKGNSIKVKAEIDGTLISEISETANGVKIKLSDRMKAIEWLSAHMGMATEEQKARIALYKKQAEGNTMDDGNTGVIVLAPVLEESEEDE